MHDIFLTWDGYRWYAAVQLVWLFSIFLLHYTIRVFWHLFVLSFDTIKFSVCFTILMTLVNVWTIFTHSCSLKMEGLLIFVHIFSCFICNTFFPTTLSGRHNLLIQMYHSIVLYFHNDVKRVSRNISEKGLLFRENKIVYMVPVTCWKKSGSVGQ